jgi:hypothetical protein
MHEPPSRSNTGLVTAAALTQQSGRGLSQRNRDGWLALSEPVLMRDRRNAAAGCPTSRPF